MQSSVAMRTPRRSYSLLLLLALGMSILLIWSDYSHRAIVESLQSENQQLHSQFQKVDQKLGFLQGHVDKVASDHQQHTQSEVSKGEDIVTKLSYLAQQLAEAKERVQALRSRQEEHEGEHVELNEMKYQLEKHIVEEEREEREGGRMQEHPPLAQGKAGIDYEKIASSTLLLVITHNRDEYLKRCLSHIALYHPSKGFPVLISQDSREQAGVARVVKTFQQENQHSFSIRFVQHSPTQAAQNGYFALADHYKYALTEAFNTPGIERVIILEEDLEIAVDFFEYFLATAPLLDGTYPGSRHASSATPLLAVSAWNDNGFEDRVKRKDFVFRSDFFPGLGWMLNKAIWNELSAKWPRAYWDDWLREESQRKGRHILHPEISRTFHFGKKGTSNSQYGSYLDRIKLNSEFVPFTTMDLGYLEEDKWEQEYLEPIYSLPVLSSRHDVESTSYQQVRVNYNGNNHFEQRAREFGVMDNIKANVPRTAYKGVVSFWLSNVLVHLTPSERI